MKQTRKRQTKSNTSQKLSVIRKAFSNRKSRRGIVGGAWSTKDLLTAMVVYGRKQNPQIVANVENESTKSPEDIVKDIQNILAPTGKNISAPTGNADNIYAVLEDQTVKKAISNYKLKQKTADEAANKSAKAANKSAANKAAADKAAADKAKEANEAKNAIDNAVYSVQQNSKVQLNEQQRTDLEKAIEEAINETNPISDNSKQQLTIVLPFFLQIYESLYDDKNYEGSTKISRHTTIPNRAVMEYVVREIQKIEKTHPHPQLFESIFYFWNIFNLPTALDVMMAYLSEIPLGESSASRPGQVVTIVEKELGNASSFQEWDKNTTKPHDYRIYTKVFGQKFNPFRYADGALLALTKYPFTTYNPHITRRDMEIHVDKETGAFENITNTSQELLPQIRGKNSLATNISAKAESPLATNSLTSPLTNAAIPLVSVINANLVTPNITTP